MVKRANTVSMDIQPNPATDKVLLSMDMIPKGTWVLDILDMNGKIVKTVGSFSQEDNSRFSRYFDVSEIPGGMYTVRLSQDDVIYMTKLVVNQ